MAVSAALCIAFSLVSHAACLFCVAPLPEWSSPRGGGGGGGGGGGVMDGGHAFYIMEFEFRT